MCGEGATPVDEGWEPGHRPGLSPSSRLVADPDLVSLVPASASRGSCDRGLAAAGPAGAGRRGEAGQWWGGGGGTAVARGSSL